MEETEVIADTPILPAEVAGRVRDRAEGALANLANLPEKPEGLRREDAVHVLAWSVDDVGGN